MPEVILTVEQGNTLARHFEGIRQLASEYEKAYNADKIDNIIKEMDAMESLLKQNFNDEFKRVFYEIREVLLCIQSEEMVDIEAYPHLFSAFGRTQQYISFVKK